VSVGGIISPPFLADGHTAFLFLLDSDGNEPQHSFSSEACDSFEEMAIGTAHSGFIG
jgi:hypothetical protein